MAVSSFHLITRRAGWNSVFDPGAVDACSAVYMLLTTENKCVGRGAGGGSAGAFEVENWYVCTATTVLLPSPAGFPIPFGAEGAPPSGRLDTLAGHIRF